MDKSETWSDLLSISLIRRRSTQVLGSLFDFQLLADLPADLFALLIQELLHAGVREVRVLVQTELLQNRQPTWVALNGSRGSNDETVKELGGGRQDRREILKNEWNGREKM